ncbi:hypothetical protein ACLOJK_032108 [Asimina triloba]
MRQASLISFFGLHARHVVSSILDLSKGVLLRALGLEELRGLERAHGWRRMRRQSWLPVVIPGPRRWERAPPEKTRC